MIGFCELECDVDGWVSDCVICFGVIFVVRVGVLVLFVNYYFVCGVLFFGVIGGIFGVECIVLDCWIGCNIWDVYNIL